MVEQSATSLRPDWYSNLAVSPIDGGILTGSMDRTIRLWNLETCNERQRFVGHQGWPRHVAFSGDGTRILSGCESVEDPTARIWDVKTGEELHRLRHPTGVRAVAYSDDGQWVLTGAEDGMARLWDAASGQLASEFEGHRTWVKAAVFLPDSRRFLTGSGNDVFLWSIKPGRWSVTSDQCLRAYGVNGLLQNISVSPTGRLFAVGSEAAIGGRPGAVEVVDMETWEPLMYEDPMGRQESVYGTAFSSDGTLLASGHGDKVARLWDLATRSLLYEFREGHLTPVHSCLFLADGQRLLLCGEDSRIHCWSIKSGQELLRRRLVPEGIMPLSTNPPHKPPTLGTKPMSTAEILAAARANKSANP